MNICRLNHLRSLSFSPSNRTDPQSDQCVFHIYTLILAQLYQLRSSHDDFLNATQFLHLRHLGLERFIIDLLKHISSAAPRLLSLGTSLSLDASHTEMIYEFKVSFEAHETSRIVSSFWVPMFR